MPLLAIFVGSALAALALLTRSGELTANLDLMNLKTNLAIIGGALFVSGVVSHNTSRLIVALKGAPERRAADKPKRPNFLASRGRWA